MQLATEHLVPVVVRGAGSGLAGGASAHEGELVLDPSGMDRILSIDPVEQLAVVEPGVLNAQVSIAAADHGLFYARRTPRAWPSARSAATSRRTPVGCAAPSTA